MITDGWEATRPVDICVLKVHDGPGGSYGYGSCTLCMKNHLGTFMNSDSTTGNIGDATGLHSIPAICEINKHPAILGGNPARQQLCIVDGLLANAKSPAGSWDTRVDRIVMGTFAPIVDYLTAKNVLFNTAVMTVAAKATTGAAAIPQFLTTFDYAETDALEWIEFVPGSGTVTPTGGSGGGSSGAGGAAGNGGTSGAGGARGGSGGVGGARNGGTSGAGGAGSGGTSGAGGAGSGGATAAGGTTENGGTTSSGGGSGGTGGLSTSGTSASGGATATGETTAGNRTASSSAGGSAGTTEATSGKAAARSSGGGCSVAGVDCRATPWGAMLAFGAVVAGKLRRLVGGGDQ
jgi:hypothetical protein